jgi:hypothetical protein
MISALVWKTYGISLLFIKGIGYKNGLPWKLPNEYKYFMNMITKEKNTALIMGLFFNN